MIRKKILGFALTGALILSSSSLAYANEVIPISIDEVELISIEANNFGFIDISENHWAYGDIQNLIKEELITNIWSGDVLPTTLVTKQDFATLLDNTFNFENDIDFSDYPLLNQLYNEENSDENISRIDVAQAITESFRAKDWNVATTLMYPVFEDTNDIEGAHIGGLSFVFNASIMRGLPDNTFKPYDDITFSELAASINRTLDVIAIAQENQFYEETSDTNEGSSTDSTDVITSYNDLMETATVIVDSLDDESLKEDYKKQLQSIELTRDGYENKIFRLNTLISELEQHQ
ncbi:S-layer family protein [Natranaerovirga hydrolytica]|uniref:S-layer family protein n=1 Tax=Natranaerovirga hydrolytica TaxID=680378 RepID=A0A4R1MMW3_9FIRM|nr:S-layer homology domain-containing protein [Natranaerovirga hydrolytica]TCK93242.1 S-layer family protein [Natranaerovirga hydrolytica]